MLSLIISALLMVVMCLYISGKIGVIKINYLCIKNWLIIFLASSLIVINYIYCSSLIKIIISLVIISCTFKMLFPNDKFSKFVVLATICQLLTLISEICFILIFTIMKDLNAQGLIDSSFGKLIANLFIVGITTILVNISIVKKICVIIINKVESLNEKYLVITLVAATTIVNFLLFSIYYEANLITSIIMNTMFIFFITFITYKILDNKNKLLKEQNKIMIYKAENDALINSLNAYEKVADKHRVINHENKNQLSAIKQMIVSEDDRAVDYINSLLGKTLLDNELIIDKTKRIPSGGLQGIVYQKMLLMENSKIKCSLNISKDLKDLDFKRLDIDTNVDLCKIVGVFLDNAIEEVTNLSYKIIDIELYVDATKFCVSISNNYGKNKDFSKIGIDGYTTKGTGHGHGLTLVKDILTYNRRLQHERKVSTKYFTQIVKISKMRIVKKKKK